MHDNCHNEHQRWSILPCHVFATKLFRPKHPSPAMLIFCRKQPVQPDSNNNISIQQTHGRVSRPAAALSASGHSHVGVGRVVDLVLDQACRPHRLLEYGPDHGDRNRVAQHHADGAVGQVQCRRRRRDDVLLLEALSLVGGFDVVGRQPLAWMFYDLASASRRSLIDD